MQHRVARLPHPAHHCVKHTLALLCQQNHQPGSKNNQNAIYRQVIAHRHQELAALPAKEEQHPRPRDEVHQLLATEQLPTCHQEPDPCCNPQRCTHAGIDHIAQCKYVPWPRRPLLRGWPIDLARGKAPNVVHALEESIIGADIEEPLALEELVDGHSPLTQHLGQDQFVGRTGECPCEHVRPQCPRHKNRQYTGEDEQPKVACHGAGAPALPCGIDATKRCYDGDHSDRGKCDTAGNRGTDCKCGAGIVCQRASLCHTDRVIDRQQNEKCTRGIDRKKVCLLDCKARTGIHQGSQ